MSARGIGRLHGKSMKYLTSLLLVLILCVTAGCSSSDPVVEDLKGSISGSVSDLTTGDPISGANILLSPGGHSVVTGSDGRFAFDVLEPGEYIIEVSKEGYTSNTAHVTVKAGENSTSHLLIGRLPSSIISDKTQLEFGDQVETLSFTIVNRGYKDLEFVVVTGNCEWLSVKPAEGVLKYEKTETIVVNLLRDKLPMGANEAVIVVRSLSGDGNAEIKVTAINGNSTATVNTLETTDITSTSATLNGKVINIGEPKYTERGFVYSTNSTPTVSDNIQKLSSPVNENPEFSCRIENLATMKVYYVRSYIVQNGEVLYGNILSFTTSQQKTVVTTSAATNIGANKATLNGAVTVAGVPAYTEKGFCYSSYNSNPDISDSKKVVAGDGKGNFSADLNTLDYPATYYARAYAIQGGGVVYGNVITFNTSGQTTVLSTSAVTDVYASRATFNGMIRSIGEPPYSERGFCYSSYGTPSIHSNKIVVNGTGTGAFSVSVTDLDYPAQYNVCAYVLQAGEPLYGNVVSFSTETREPSVSTSAVTDITPTSATFNGIITDLGIPQATRRGFCYSSYTSSPSISDDHWDDYLVNTANFKRNITGLAKGITYYVRAYAYQDGHYYYGNAVSFSTVAEPEVITGNPTDLTKEESMFSTTWNVTLHGTVLSEGSTPYSERGFVCDTSTSATVSSYNSVTVPGSGTGSFSVTVTGLENMKTYYVRAYVKVGKKYYYGDPKKISTF